MSHQTRRFTANFSARCLLDEPLFMLALTTAIAATTGHTSARSENILALAFRLF